MAPGLLKAVATAQGFTSVALDLNIDVCNHLRDSQKKTHLENALASKTIDRELSQEVYDLVKYCAEKILSHSPKIIGLSLLTSQSQVFTVWLCVYIKNHFPDIKIIIGGSGIKEFIESNSNSYCEWLKNSDLIDHYIMGDGEAALTEFLHGNLTYPGIDSNHWVQLTDISKFPYPDYTDYDFNRYATPMIPITDSRGCVRACEFCDIIEHWKKFVYRPAEHLFNEMLHQIQVHGINDFSMMNSLTNGNVKEFGKWLDLIVEYNQSRSMADQISWKGYFIIREPHQHPEELFKKLHDSNASLILGVESVIQHVRWGMKKKFTNDAIDYHLEMAQKYQVPLKLLMIVGSPMETLEDYEFTKQWFRDRFQYAQNSVTDVNLSLASILPGTEWERKQKVFDIIPGNFTSAWISKNNQITPQVRLKFYQELVELVKPFTISDSYAQNQRWAISVMS
jgi:hypothetical protein